MTNQEKRKEQQLALFLHHPLMKSFFMTSDFRAFTEEHRADAHANTLVSKDVEQVFRADFKELAHEDLLLVDSNELSLINKKENTELEDTRTEEQKKKDKEKAEREALTPRYIELFDKKPALQYNSVKIKELIAAEELKLASDNKVENA